MKKKELSALHGMKPIELIKVIREEKQKLADYLINRYSKQSKNVHEAQAHKRKIAVASTVLRSKELSHE